MFGAVEGEIESGIVEGLQKIVDRVDFKGAECVAIIGRGEDDAW